MECLPRCPPHTCAAVLATCLLGGAAHAQQPVTVLMVGDVMLARAVGKTIRDSGDARQPFRGLENTLQGADILVGNLEGPISGRGHAKDKEIVFCAQPQVVDGLRLAGFDVLNLANNHGLDFGPEALDDTLALLQGSGITPVGAGTDFEEAHTARILTVRGTRVGFLGYTNLIAEKQIWRRSRPCMAHLTPSIMVADIRRARPLVDVLIVTVHWGNEYEYRPTDEQRSLGRMAVAAGADAVVGHHPHVPQPLERYRHGVIAYSLGNFVFDQHGRGPQHGWMLSLEIAGGRLRSVQPVAVVINDDHQPLLDGNRVYLPVVPGSARR
jgi:poly-gamma-glutamate synthesis protein (capsule biosynthesis protein)